MKFYYYGMAVLASLGMLAGCSNEDLTVDAPEAVVVEPYIPGDSEYPIQLGYSGSLSTDISVRGLGQGAFESVHDMDHLGVFCLACGKQSNTTATPDINWFDDGYGLGCLIRNNKASMTAKAGTGGETGVTASSTLTWTDADSETPRQYYYPLTNYYAYEFYGYYPWTENVTCADNRVTAHIDIDGTVDVIWGTVKGGTTKWSARYYRTYGAGAENPSLSLNHLLTRLHFTVKTGANPLNADEVFPDADQVKVSKLQILEADNKFDLVVADLAVRIDEDGTNDLSASNVLTLAADNEPKTFDLEYNGAPISETNLVPLSTVLDEGVDMGEMLLYPKGTYTLLVELYKPVEGGNPALIQTVQPIDITSATTDLNNPEERLFRPGRRYDVTIMVHDFKPIEAEAKLNDWIYPVSNPPQIDLN